MQVAISTGSGAFAILRATRPRRRRASRPSASPRPATCSSRRSRAARCRRRSALARTPGAPETSLGSGTAAPSVSADSSGDVVVTWPGSMRAYDASPPTVTVNAPSSPASPGSHNWSVTTSDVWSDSGTTSWSFDDNGTRRGRRQRLDRLARRQHPGTRDRDGDAHAMPRATSPTATRRSRFQPSSLRTLRCRRSRTGPPRLTATR